MQLRSRSPLRALLLAGASLLLAAAVPAAAAERERAAPFRTLVLASGDRVGNALAGRSWGGTYTAASGEKLQLRFSNDYPVDEAEAVRWANFLASLVHGAELERVSVFFAPLAEVRTVCGGEVVACYSRSEQLIVTTREDVRGAPRAASVLAHEYAHHVALNRSNAPWDASNYGTKRWATHLGICAAALARIVHPGRSGIPSLNPGEGFAEAYRVLNERRLDLPESAWTLVDRRFYPDERALAAVTQDVLEPWAPAAVARSGTFRATGSRRHGLAVATPLDGVVRVRLTGAPRAAYRLAVVRADGLVLTRGAWGELTIERNVCGLRHVIVVVERRPGRGTYRVDVTAP